MKTICSVDGCDNKVKSLGYCDKHYKRKWKGNNVITSKESLQKSLPNNFIALNKNSFTIVDDDIADHIKKYPWSLSTDGYAVRNTVKNKKKTILRLHRHILKLKKGEFCDHINRNKLDNRMKNLRKCTQQQNNFNNSKCGKSGYRGVRFAKHAKSWRATVILKGKRYELGYFKNKMDAVIARDNLAKKLHGEFAFLNFPILA